MIKQKTFSTFDFGLTNSLICMGFKLIDLDKTNPRKIKFIFENSENIQTITDQYWNDELQIPARRFFDTQRTLKSRLYS